MSQYSDLYIAEKPSLAQAIAAVLPGEVSKTRTHITVGNVALTWCVGHLLEQCVPEDYDARYAKWNAADLPIVPSRWRNKPRSGAAAQLDVIKKLLPCAARIVHAGDPDSEGQLIVDEVLQHFGNQKPVFRILVNDYNPTKIREAIASITSNNSPRFAGWSNWALCRSRIDWLIGMNMSRAFTLRGQECGYGDVLSVGRVQTPTLAIVVARDEAIEAFRSIPYFGMSANVAAGDHAFTATWRAKPEQAGLDESGRLVDGAVASALVAKLANAAARVAVFDKTSKNQAAPLPFDLKSLQMAANDLFGLTAAKTLEIAQSLYETHKVTTYPRSDCAYLSKAQHAETPARMAAVAANLPGMARAVASADMGRMSKAFDDAKVTAHHGIVPTAHRVDAAALTEDERKVYELIAKAYIAQFYPAHEYEQTTITLDIGGERFIANGRRAIAAGWKAVFELPEEAATEADAVDERQALPQVAVGTQLSNRGVRIGEKKTTPPARFTEKTLLAAMGEAHKYATNPVAKARLKEGQGIGTPATSAGIIEELKKRGYLSVQGKQLVSTPAARTLIHALPPVSTDPGFTGLTEQTLDQVAAGNITPDAFVSKSAQLIAQLVAQARSAKMVFPVHTCPTCKQGRLQRRKGPSGYFWGCNRYEEGCKTSFDDKKGAPNFGPKTTKRKTGSKSGTKSGSTAKKKPAARSTGTRKVAKRTGIER